MPSFLRGETRAAAWVCGMLVSGCGTDKGGLGEDPLDGAATPEAAADSGGIDDSVETSPSDTIPPSSDAADDAGNPNDDADNAKDDAGNAMDGAGNPSDDASNPNDDAGSPIADAGNPIRDANKSNDDANDAAAAADTGSKCASTVLTPTTVVASTVMRSAAYAIDDNFTTRWESLQNTLPQWIYLDFGAPVFVDRVQIAWEKACARDYDLQVSNDAATWTTMRSIVGNTVGIQAPAPADWTIAADHTGLSGVGRYMRVSATVRCQLYGYSIWEMRAFGDTSANCTP